MATLGLSDPLRDLYLSLLDFSLDLEDQSDAAVQEADHLATQLEAKSQEFASLLDKPSRNEISRRTVTSGRVTIDEVDYSLNDEFKQTVIQLADNLDLDELKAAELLLSAQNDTEALDRSALEVAHINFHSRRKNLLGCLRFALKFSTEDDNDVQVSSKFRRAIKAIVAAGDGRPGQRSSFGRRCLVAMSGIKRWITDLEEKSQGASILGLAQVPEYVETMELQRSSLCMQCEDLGVVLHHLVKLGYTRPEDLEELLSTVQRAEKYDSNLVFYMPFYLASISRFGSPEGQDSSFPKAKSLHERITNAAEADSWTLRYLRAATITWWLGEYSGWFVEPHEQVLAHKIDPDTEMEAQSKLFVDALKDGAFDFVLSLCADVRSTEAYDPLRSSLHQWLQRKAPSLLSNSIRFSDGFRVTLMEQLEMSVDAFITNMPGDLRRLRIDQDESRLRLLQVDPDQQDYDLEKFLLVISYVFEGRSDAARAFWSYPDANWYGFLQWSSKRLSTPRACAVCEMLLSLSQTEENALAAHQFLVNEGSASVGKTRRSHSLSWAQILHELRFAASEMAEGASPAPRLLDRSARARTQQSINEPETYNMLESYLRLMAKIAGDSGEAQSWLLSQTPPLSDLLLQLCSPLAPTRLRACAFEAMRALMYNQSSALRDNFWPSLDKWIFVGPPPPDRTRTPSPAVAPVWTPDLVFERIADGYEESLTFVSLLTMLLLPAADAGSLHDALPFPESLGSAQRMPGVEPYVDFVFGRLFATKSVELQDMQQQRFLRLRCLDFVVACLRTFNESLIIFANQSNVAVDSAIKASSLATYARLHPFARTMEWLFNDGVLRALFDTARQDAQEVAKAPPDSLLPLSLLRSIEVMLAVLDLQSTYFDVIRPLTRSEVDARRSQIANNTYASFEDVILQNLQVTVNLGLYATTEHAGLVTSSLALLEKLVTSPRVMGLDVVNFGRRTGQSKMLGIFEVNNEASRVAKSLVLQMLPDFREAKKGPASPAYTIKTSILAFLQRCLEALPTRPNLAHRLLGFACTGDKVEVTPESSLARGHSLLHAVVNVISGYPSSDGFSLQSWLLEIRLLAFDVLQPLWTSPLSAVYTMTELRSHGFLFGQLATAIVIAADTLFDGKALADPQFIFTGSAACCNQFLRQRSLLLDYAAIELKTLSKEHAPTLKARVVSALLGTTVLDDGNPTSNPSVFELFDFTEIDLGGEIERPKIGPFGTVELDVCLEMAPGGYAVYNLASVDQLLNLRLQEAIKAGDVLPQDESRARSDLSRVVDRLRGINHRTILVDAKLKTLKSWSRLLILVIEIGDLDPDLKAIFVLHVLQMILPKLEQFTLYHPAEALELARLARALLFNVDLTSASFGKGHAGDVAADRLYQLFVVCLRGIHSPTATDELREIFYIICHRYSNYLAENRGASGALGPHGTRAIRASGEGLIETVCEDAYAGLSTCRICALLFLDGLLFLSMKEDSSYVLDCLVRMNFLGLLLDTIKVIPAELQDTPAQDVPLLLSYYDAKLSLLLRISQTRSGATHLFDLGVFQCIRDSGLFSADPDIGIDIEDPNALAKYYRLLLAALRIITSVVMSCGPHNPRTLKEARNFLTQHRQSMTTAFKRQGKVGGVRVDHAGDLGEIVKHYILLITATDFLKFEEAQLTQRSVAASFT